MRGWRNHQLGLPAGPQQFTQNLIKLSAGVLPELHIHATRLATESERLGASTPDTCSALPRVEVRPSRGKGFGLFAVDPIQAYTKVLEDDALLSLAQGEDLPQLWAKYCLLPPEHKQAFEELSSPSHLVAKEATMISKLEQRGYESSEAAKMARVNSRWQANAFKTGAANIGSPGSHKWPYSLFRIVARINHSCAPNACAHYRPSGTEAVYALRDIEAGEEIEIAYFDITMAFSDRQARAKSWGFQCSCPVCSKTGKFAAPEYEQRLSYVHRHLSVDYTMLDSETVIDSTQTAISIAHSADHPWLVIALPKLYLSPFNLEVQMNGRTAKAREALEKVLEWEEKTTGPESPSSQQRRKALMDFDAVG